MNDNQLREKVVDLIQLARSSSDIYCNSDQYSTAELQKELQTLIDTLDTAKKHYPAFKKEASKLTEVDLKAFMEELQVAIFSIQTILQNRDKNTPKLKI